MVHNIMLIMNPMLCNSRGAGRKAFLNNVRDMIGWTKPNILIIVEPRVSGNRARSLLC